MYPRLPLFAASAGADIALFERQSLLSPQPHVPCECLPPFPECRHGEDEALGKISSGQINRFFPARFAPHTPDNCRLFRTLVLQVPLVRGRVTSSDCPTCSRLPLLARATFENTAMQSRFGNDADSTRSAFCASPAEASCERRFYALQCLGVAPALFGRPRCLPWGT